MNIYFLNKRSKLKSPFEIIDAKRQKIMKIGDFCVRDSSDGVSIWIVCSDLDSWGSCKCVAKSQVEYGAEGNALIYSFDGISQRQGNVDMLESLSGCFDDGHIKSFFQNAIDILQFRCDFWEMSVFSQILALPSIDTTSVQSASNGVITVPKTTTKFSSYLSEEALVLMCAMLAEGQSHRAIYTSIREKFPEMFRKAFQRFLKENPGTSIYDEK